MVDQKIGNKDILLSSSIIIIITIITMIHTITRGRNLKAWFGFSHRVKKLPNPRQNKENFS